MSFSSSSSVSHKLQHLVSCLNNFYQHILLEIDPFLFQFVYFLSVSVLGFCLLLVTKPRDDAVDKPSNLDLLFTSVSATTTSSMSVVEMEFFSNNQLLVLTFLMFVGGDIFISMVGLQCSLSRLRQMSKDENEVNGSFNLTSISASSHDQENVSEIDGHHLRYNSIQFLGFVVMAYFLVNHMVGFILIPIYLAMFPSTRTVLKRKSLSPLTFVIFTTVSTFTNCGFIPTNENMIVFKRDSGLLLILIPQVLLGNTLYPSALRFCVWFAGKFMKKDEAKYLLESGKQEICYYHWLSGRHSRLLVISVVGFVLVQFVMFCCMEWSSEGLSELNNYERVIGVLFESVNSRHAGETILDLWNLKPAVWVLFVFMMYLPPYTSYLGTNNYNEEGKRKRRRWVEEVMLSPSSYLTIFLILICITEREKMQEDPLNFNAFSILIELVSAYGNVGFSKGYNCEAQVKANGTSCVTKWYGFSGKWSNQGKLILIVTMLFGTLKKYHLDEGRAWKLM